MKFHWQDRFIALFIKSAETEKYNFNDTVNKIKYKEKIIIILKKIINCLVDHCTPV